MTKILVQTMGFMHLSIYIPMNIIQMLFSFASVACILFGTNCLDTTVSNSIPEFETAHMNDFDQMVLSASSRDGDIVILSHGKPFQYQNFPTILIGDDTLGRYLDVRPGSSVALELKSGRTDFNVYDIPESWSKGDMPPWSVSEPKVFLQPSGVHPELGLEYASDVYSQAVQVTLVFRNASKAKQLSNWLHELSAEFPEMVYKCWDLVESDFHGHVNTMPGLSLSSKAHGKELISLRPPLTKESVRFFLEGNQYKLKVFREEL